MSLFKIDKIKVKKVSAVSPSSEKSLQKLFESNLGEILDITFLASEYSTSWGGRIDTLGIDKSGSPVIIEYKRNQNDNVINQGLSYLRWLLDHKADFEKICADNKLQNQIDWDSPRVICIAESYNKFDLDTVDILPIKIELLRYEIYENDILLIEPENQQKVRIANVSGVKTSQKQKSTLQKLYSIDEHLKNVNPSTKNLFYTLREKIIGLDEKIIEEPRKKYIAYKLSRNFVDIVIKKYGLKVFLNLKSGQLQDPLGIARNLAKPKIIGHWGNGDYEVKVENSDYVEKALELIKQSYKLNK